jgi:hypothetical protein
LLRHSLSTFYNELEWKQPATGMIRA